MNTATESDDLRLRGYLLGQMTEAEAESLEGQILEDEELFQATCSVEDDLFDDYAAGRLTDREREAFLRRYGRRSDRLAFSDALQRHNVVPLRRRTLRPSALAAAAAILLVVSGIFFMQRREPATVPHAVVARSHPVVIAPALRSLTVALVLGTSRGESKTPSIALTPDISKVDLRIRIDPDDVYNAYDVIVRSPAGAEVVRQRATVVTSAGERSLAITMPASSLATGTYELAVTGDGQDLGFLPIEVNRRK